jgi:malonyl CoA-acyl carrier protein transacylase
MLAYLFPGQGSQVRGMGGELFNEFTSITHIADEILDYSIKELCLQDPQQQLNQTQFTQPALFTVNALYYLKHLQTHQQSPDFAAGHSLGEYNALFAAGVFDFATGLQLVKKRGELMSQASGGGMAAVIGLPLTEVQNILTSNQLKNVATANHNSLTQIVISGPASDIEQAKNIFTKLPGVNFILLKVSGAFHSPLMASAAETFSLSLAAINFSVPTLPVLANIDAHAYHPAVTSSNLTRQITHTVRWTNTIQYLLRFPDIILTEMGPGNVLTNLTRRIKANQ